MNFSAAAKHSSKAAIALAALCLAAALIFSSCSAKTAEWTADYDSALVSAKEQTKPVFLVFTGMDWDESSKPLFDTVLSQDDFLKKAGDAVLVHIDFPESDGTDITEELMKSYTLAEQFSVQMMPAMFMISASGYVIEEIPFDPEALSTAKAVLEKMAPSVKKNKKIAAALEKLAKAEGPAKVAVISEIDELTSQAHRHLLTSMIQEVPTLDPENKSGLLGKYKLMLTYPVAMETFQNQDVAGAVKMFTDLIDSGILSADEKQEAYYSSAYLHAMGGTSANDTVLEFLQKSYDAKPDSENAKNIITTMDQLKQMAAGKAPDASGAQTAAGAQTAPAAQAAPAGGAAK